MIGVGVAFMVTRKSSRPWAETESQFPEAFLNLSSSIDSKSPEPWFWVGGRDLGPVVCGNVMGADAAWLCSSQWSCQEGVVL